MISAGHKIAMHLQISLVTTIYVINMFETEKKMPPDVKHYFHIHFI